MIEKIMKAVKSSSKKRGRNITIGAVIGFLLSCTAVMGADEYKYLWIKGEAGQIGFSTDHFSGKVDTEWYIDNPYSENNWDESASTYINNITLLASSSLNLYGDLNDFEFINKGSLTAKDEYSATGITTETLYGEKCKMETLENRGLISANVSNWMVSSYGIIHNRLEIKNLSNTGLISADGSGSGYGISINQGKVVNLTNIGSIYGNTTAVKIYDGRIGSFTNYGILANRGSVDEIVNGIDIITDPKDAGENKVLNYGLMFTAGGTYKTTETGFKNFGQTFKGVDGYTIINAKAEGSGKDNITGTESITIEGGSLKYNSHSATISQTEKYILNGITDTLLVSGNSDKNILNNSVINAYTTAVKFDDTKGGKLTLSGTTVNGGLDGKSNAITGGGEADILVLENTVINGNIDMKDGANTIEVGDEIFINGNITTGTGNDVITAGNNVYINGNVDMGTGENKLTFGNNVYINGDISTGSNGVDFISGSETYLNGNVNFTAEKDIFKLGEKSVINKDIDMKEGNDELTIGAGSIVNGILNGGDGADTLQFGTAQVTRASNNDGTINISKDITGFENINVGANVTFASDLTITDTNKIVLEKDGVLLLTLDKSITDNSSGSEKMIGHALYNKNNITVSSTGGKMLLDLDGATGNEIITFGDTVLDDSIVAGDNETLDITSKVHTIKAGENSNEVVLVLRWTIPEILKYKGLNEVYHGIGSVNDLIGNFNIKNDEQLTTFIGYLNNIYAGSPYSYSSELSRKSAGMFRDIVTENQFKANTGKWMIYGGLTHVDGGTKDTYYGKGYYTYDVGSSDIDGDTKITGAYMLGEYGVSDTLTSGVVIGGNKLKSDLSNGSKVDGSALYLGAYAKKYIGNLKVTGGAGFQYGDYDADRLAINKVASSTGTPVIKYSDNYNDITYDIYLNGRYSHNIGDNLFLEPYATLSYTYIDQDGADEGSKTLAIETDSKSFDYTTAKVGADLKKVIPHEKGKSTLSAGVSYTRILDGADEEHITGRFKGGRDFDILVAHKNEHSIGLNAKYALELENGILFDVKGTYSVERDSHNQSGKNKTKGEWIVGTGLGYKF